MFDSDVIKCFEDNVFLLVKAPPGTRLEVPVINHDVSNFFKTFQTFLIIDPLSLTLEKLCHKENILHVMVSFCENLQSSKMSYVIDSTSDTVIFVEWYRLFVLSNVLLMILHHNMV